MAGQARPAQTDRVPDSLHQLSGAFETLVKRVSPSVVQVLVELSQRGDGRAAAPDDLADMMLDLQDRGCHNINLVSPSHVVAQVLAALPAAVARGLRLPLVYNTGGYDSLEALALLDGVVDIYMPDMKYADRERARRLSRIRDYPAVNRAAVREMHRQVGDLVLDPLGVARRVLLVRHLVLPGDEAGTEDFI